jgi:hypothetical protein
MVELSVFMAHRKFFFVVSCAYATFVTAQRDARNMRNEIKSA